jgi:hypothetical protein
MKFQQIISKSFQVMLRTRQRTDRQTDRRTRRRLYAPPKFFGEHKKLLIAHTAELCFAFIAFFFQLVFPLPLNKTVLSHLQNMLEILKAFPSENDYNAKIHMS